MVKDPAPLPGYPEQYGLLCAVLQDATEDWRGELWGEELGPEVTTWRPFPGGPSIGAEILHMIVVEVYWLEKFALDMEPTDEEKREIMWDEIDVDKGIWPDAPSQPIKWYFDLHDRYRARTLESVKRWAAPETLKPFYGDQTVSLRWVLGHLLQHETYHGGQVVMLYNLWKSRESVA